MQGKYFRLENIVETKRFLIEQKKQNQMMRKRNNFGF